MRRGESDVDGEINYRSVRIYDYVRVGRLYIGIVLTHPLELTHNNSPTQYLSLTMAIDQSIRG